MYFFSGIYEQINSHDMDVSERLYRWLFEARHVDLTYMFVLGQPIAYVDITELKRLCQVDMKKLQSYKCYKSCYIFFCIFSNHGCSSSS